jgi:hypothetical protein
MVLRMKGPMLVNITKTPAACTIEKSDLEAIS